MGLLDFASDPQGMQGLALLAAAGPSMTPMNGASRIALAGSTYRGLLDDQLKQKMGQAQLQNASLDLGMKQQQFDRMNSIRDELTRQQTPAGAPMQPAAPGFSTPMLGDIPMFSQGTTMAAAPQAGMQTGMQTAPQGAPQGGDSVGRQVSNRLLQQAAVYAKYGDVEGANKLYEQAAKFMPEVKEMGVLMRDNKPVNVITYKDGRQEITDLAPTPKVHYMDTGGSVIPVSEYTQQPLGAPFKKTVSPDAAMADARERSQFAQTMRKDYTVAGFNPDGTPAGDMETTAKAIADGRLPPPSGMALTNQKNQRILARVMEINPNYDYTSVAAKKAAAAAFTTGTQGNALRSVATASAHLDQLGELADAMGNGNTQIVNKVGNYFATQAGDPKVTNFDAIKNIVGQEVVKAIVAGGGSAGERDEAAKAFSDAASPAQIKGAIQHYRAVMGAQKMNLMAQRRGAGLPDDTLPAYLKEGEPTAAAPAAAGAVTPAFRWNAQTRKLEKVN